MHVPGTIVCGAGILGLAVARELTRRGGPVAILEQAHRYGEGVSSRNSEVVHAGLYYDDKKQPHKAKMCVTGREMLIEYCKNKQIAVERCGKLIVVTTREEKAALKQLWERAIVNGLVPGRDMEMIDGKQACAMEPALQCIEALHVKCTAIVDARGVMGAMEAELIEAGVPIAYGSTIINVTAHGNGFQITQSDNTVITCDNFVNAAGLSALEIAQNTNCPHAPLHEANKRKSLPTHFAKGNYFKLKSSIPRPFSRLIYPIPEQHGLGIHFTLDVHGGHRFGPNVQWIPASSQQLNYDVDPAIAQDFYPSIRRYWPDLPPDSLQPDFAGIRPKMPDAMSNPTQDFVIWTPSHHGVKGLVHLLGMESPGLTSSMAIAVHVANELL